jgi:putative ABC transport system permease protein
VRFSSLAHLYVSRVRHRPVQELLAGVGIAVGVALAFAVQVANSSVAASAEEIARGLAGSADVQLVSRDSRGFDERMVDRVRRVKGVVRAAGILEQRATIVGPSGHAVPIHLVGADAELAALGGAFTRNLAAGGLELRQGIVVPHRLARDLGVPAVDAGRAPMERLPRAAVRLRGQEHHVRIAAVFGRETIGATADMSAALLPRPELQRLSGLRGRVTRVPIDISPGSEGIVRKRLGELGAGQIGVTSVDDDVEKLKQATAANDRATAFFAMVSALVGLLLAFNAMLMTAPERRRLIAELRLCGSGRRQVVLLVLSQAVVLGVVASAVGLAAGNLLARSVFHDSPAYLTGAFAIGTQTVVTLGTLVLTFLGGVAVAVLAATPPLLDLRDKRAVEAVRREGGEGGHAISPHLWKRLFAAALGLGAVVVVLLRLVPSASIVAVIALAIATVLLVPGVFAAVMAAAEATVECSKRLKTLTLALFALRATTLRSLALAATGALAIFGSVAIGGAREDLISGISRYVRGYVSTADLWVVNGADDQATKDIRSRGLAARLAETPGVASVRRYYGGYLDFSERRVWVIARPAQDHLMVPRSEVLDGSTADVRRSGWVAVAKQVADAQKVGVGDRLTVPTPTGPKRFRIAATTTNLGWPPGALVMNARDYRDAWPRAQPTALEIDAAANADVERVRDAVQRRLPQGHALHVQTAGERADQAIEFAHQGLKRLQQIALLLLIAAALAIAAAMSAAIWERRPALAALRRQSAHPQTSRRVLLLESALVLLAGCFTGALTGVAAQVMIDDYLERTTGFSAPFSIAAGQTGGTLALTLVLALLVIAVPVVRAARVPPHLGLQE